MTFRCFVETNTGRLVSVGSVFPDVPPLGLSFIDRSDKPDLEIEVWQEGTRDWGVRPPVIRVDRFDGDLLTHPKYRPFREVYDSLSNPDQAAIRNAFRKLLGAEVQRDDNESDEIGL